MRAGFAVRLPTCTEGTDILICLESGHSPVVVDDVRLTVPRTGNHLLVPIALQEPEDCVLHRHHLLPGTAKNLPCLFRDRTLMSRSHFWTSHPDILHLELISLLYGNPHVLQELVDNQGISSEQNHSALQ